MNRSRRGADGLDVGLCDLDPMPRSLKHGRAIEDADDCNPSSERARALLGQSLPAAVAESDENPLPAVRDLLARGLMPERAP